MSRKTRRTICVAAAKSVSTYGPSRYLAEALEQRIFLSSVDVPDNVAANPGGTVTVPLNIIDTALGLQGFNVSVAYDPAQLSLAPGFNSADVALGSLFASAGGWEMVSFIDQVNGLATLSFFRDTPMPDVSGTFATLKLYVSHTASIGATTITPMGLATDGGLSFAYLPGNVQVTTTPVPPSDLIVQNVTFGSSSVTSGGTFNVGFRIRNIGETMAGASASRLRLSTDQVLTLDDKPLSPLDVAIPAIPVDSYYDYSGLITIPAATPKGQYYVGVFADAFNLAGQSDITNDAGLSPTTMNVSVLLGNVSFQPQQPFGVGSGPYSVAISDLNGDNRPDVVTANEGANTVSVLLGNGNGTFQTQVSFAVGSHPFSVAVSDVNGDNKPDIVTGNYNSDTVSVLLGNGNGGFQSQQTFSVGDGPASVALSDVNGDNKRDILTANGYSNTVSVLLGNGNGTFQPQQTFGVGSYPFSLAVSDVNGDNKPDIVTANFLSDSVSVLSGYGNGAFQTQQAFSVGDCPVSIVVADMNADNNPDILTANDAPLGDASSGTASVLLGNGNGGFQSQQTFSVGDGPASIAVSDVNRDNKLDIVTAYYSPDTASVLLGNGDGTFLAEQNFDVGSSPNSVAVADLNGDNRPDIVTANTGSNNVSVLLNASVLRPSAPLLISPGSGSSPGQVVSTVSPTFSWQTVAGADQYGLYVSQRQVDGSYQILFDSESRSITIDSASTSFPLPADVVLQEGGQYRWNMRTHNGAGWGTAFSQRLYFKYSTATTPDVPSGLTATPSGSTTIDIAWSAANSAAYYKLYRSASSSGPWTSPIATIQGLTWSDAGLDSNTQYYYRVASSNAAGDSALAAFVPAKTLITNKPAVPANVKAQLGNSGSVVITWNLVSGASYVVERSTLPSSGFVAIGYPDAGRTNVTDKPAIGTAPTTTFYYRVRSVVGGVQSDPSLAVSAAVARSTASLLSTPDVPESLLPWADVAKVYEFRWGDGSVDPEWVAVPDLTTLGQEDGGNFWNEQTVILTHGWNDSFTPGNGFINSFAEDFINGRQQQADQFNLLAVDWNGWDRGLGPKGSDPNGVNYAEGDILLTGTGDAEKSAANGISAGAVLGVKLAQLVNIQPSKIALIGHSNGAGFMAGLAEGLYSQLGQRIAELVSLDAPVATRSYSEVLWAANTVRAISHVANYYVPSVQSVDSKYWGFTNPAPLGFGMMMYGDGIANFELNYHYFPKGDAHRGVPARYAHTGHTITNLDYSEGDPWGFMTSAFVAGSDSLEARSGLWVEGTMGHFTQVDLTTAFLKSYKNFMAAKLAEGVAVGISSYAHLVEGTVNVVVNGVTEAWNGAVLAAKAVATGTQAVYHFTVNGAIEIGEATVDAAKAAPHFFAQTATSIWSGYTGALQAAGSVYLRGIDAAGQGLYWIWGKAASPLNSPSLPDGSQLMAASDAPAPENGPLASIDITIPATARLLSFTLTTINEGNADHLLVAIGDDKIGDMDLASYKGDAAGTVQLWLGDHAGESGTLHFYTPSASLTAAEYYIGNLQFIETDETATVPPPAVTVSSFDHQAGPQAISLAFTDNVSATLSMDDLVLQNLTTGQSVPAANLSINYDVSTNVVTFTFPGYSSGILPDGRYRATLPAGCVADLAGNPMTSDFTFEFFVLGGDANHDARVDIRDLYALASNWQGTSKIFSQGDFNYDGKVDAADLGVLAKNWQKNSDGTLLSASTMPAILSQPPPSPAPRRPATRTPIRLVSLIQ